jgi:tRNA G18 (ribose-2'-O)-methylase SpoU
VTQPIDSPADPRLAAYRRVGDAAWLRAGGLFVAEGRLVVERLLAAARFHIESILVTPAAQRAMSARLDGCRAAILVCSQATMNGVTGIDFHRGCLALVRRPPMPPLDGWPAGEGVLLALEGVGNPDNVGGLFRTAAAFGAAGIVVGPGTADPFYRKAVRTSMAAVLHLPWTLTDRLEETLGRLTGQGYRIAALTPAPDAQPLEAFAATCGRRTVLLLGSEGAGLSPGSLALAGDRVRIPITPAADSLNVVVAAGIALHAVSRNLP